MYPSNGIQWLQGDQGESGLPDIRAQAGFVAEDGRFFTVTGSGTDNVSFKCENTIVFLCLLIAYSNGMNEFI